VSQGRSDQNISTTITSAYPTSSARGTYFTELNLGIADHSSGRDAFENATVLWDRGDLADAREMFLVADDKFSGAAVHYSNMEGYAVNGSDQELAHDLGASANDMHMASERFILSINASLAGNNTEALTYFEEGHDLVNASMVETNASLLVLPSI
jgi:hypothetical protein